MRKSERYAGLFSSREEERAWGLESLEQLSRWLKLEPEMAAKGAPEAREMRLRSAPPDQVRTTLHAVATAAITPLDRHHRGL